MGTVHLIDYVAGNVCSLVNAIEKSGYRVEWVRKPEDVKNAEKLILPGVGHFGHCLSQLSQAGFLPAIKTHITSGKPFMGICVGLQALFAGSEEDPSVAGLGVVPQKLVQFNQLDGGRKSVPHIGWNDAIVVDQASSSDSGSWCKTMYSLLPLKKYYYVHSYMAPYVPGELEALGWTVATATYGTETFVGALARDNVFATQFHPEKSGTAGLDTLRAFLSGVGAATLGDPLRDHCSGSTTGLTRRVIACLDVRANDAGDLVVTKGDQYDVREKDADRGVRNLGKPVEMARKYYKQGADEVTFLNITSFRDCPLADLPMLEVLRQTAASVFVPLTIGGGIRATVDPATGEARSALDVAALYFASGADKVSIGSDAVTAAEEYYANGKVLSGNTAIEQISRAYGRQAVVVSIDPKRVYVKNTNEANKGHAVFETAFPGPNGEAFCWYACTVKGGRETRDLDVVQLSLAVEAMGAGELLLNCIDRDGTNSGFDLELIDQVKESVGIPVIASSGAGVPDHFREVFQKTKADAALGAGMFHRGEYTVAQVKSHLELFDLNIRAFS